MARKHHLDYFRGTKLELSEKELILYKNIQLMEQFSPFSSRVKGW